ncbi:MAG: ABC transporter substrate-binding protein [Candidatus Promineifilaceae bacterium]
MHRALRGAAALAALLLIGCRDGEPQPQIISQVDMVDGEEVVVTRVVRQTVEVPVTPVATLAPRPVVLDIPMIGEYASLDPQAAADDNAADIIENTFAALTRLNLSTGRIEPELAQRWEVSPDGLTWTFYLRDDIFWVQLERPQSSLLPGDGRLRALRPVVAGDVVFAIQRACLRETEARDAYILFIIAGCEEVYMLPEAGPADLERIAAEALGDQTLQIRLTAPAAYFATISSLALLRPAPVEHVIGMAEASEQWWLPEYIVTSGPFYLGRETLMGSQTVLERNPYWPLPFSGNVDRVNIRHLESAAEAFELWEERQLDLSPLPLADQRAILGRHEQKAVLVPRQEAFYLGYNFESEVFSQPGLRKAFGAAVDRERLVLEVYDGRAIPMRHLTPPGAFGALPFDEVGSGYYDDLARLRMAQSPYGDCRLMPQISFMVSAVDLALQQAELLREMWMEVLDCTEEQIVIEQVQFGNLLAYTRPDSTERPDMWELGWAAYYPDAHNWLADVLHCSRAENRFKRPCGVVDEQIAQAGQLVDPQGRLDLYRAIEGAFFGEEGIEPISPLYARADYILRQGWLILTPAPFGGEQYDTYRVDEAVKELEQER